MEKTNVIIIGDFTAESANREYIRLTNSEHGLNCISNISSYHSTKERMEKQFKFCKQAIDSNEVQGFRFDCIETLELFDPDSYLRDRSIIIDSIVNSVRAMTVIQAFSTLKKLTRKWSKEKKWEENIENYERVVNLKDDKGTIYYIHELINLPPTGEVTLSIIPAESESLEKDTISNIILSKLNEIEKDRPWLAEKLEIPAPTLYGKFQRDSFSAYEIIKICDILNLDLNQFKGRT